ncbi:MAG: ATP-binding protein [Caldilineaceae bacterium SB0664_bin_27]|uniref:ATP-binding protein n=1 Tax=Caldilineaceae bacterium SB0664_bin_27 TaxID=2605260 RepID=A0A6B0Z201_9CHLR|nr:ATP-binding protein [Caldilineaceae bacterium SB0664_bin_27]
MSSDSNSCEPQNTETWEIPHISGRSLPINLQANDCLFIVGPNGAGKSALIQYLVPKEEERSNFRRISAHRYSAIDPATLDVSAQRREDIGQQNIEHERYPDAQWRDYNSHFLAATALFDLVAKESSRARTLAGYLPHELEEAARQALKTRAPFGQLNELLSHGTLSITLELSVKGLVQAKQRASRDTYNVAQMSDGERNAAIIGATVLTVDPGTVLLIDEPERHLHRSIIVPFLSALFAQRSDCIFIVSTHELALPAAIPEAKVLTVRSCAWTNNQVSAWDIDLLEPNVGIPEDVRLSILGSRQKILFVEGEPTGLDLPIYHALFPGISVEARGSRDDVIRAVKGVRGSQELHHVEAFGLIDNDGMGEDNIASLSEDGVFALDDYSVESLYYSNASLDALARRQAETLGEEDPQNLKCSALQAALCELRRENGLAQKMAAKRSVLSVRNKIESQIPGREAIQCNEHPTIEVSIESPYQEELSKFKRHLDASEFDELVARYPLRHSHAFDAIARKLKFRSKADYQSALVTRIQSCDSLAEKLRGRIGKLTCALRDPL